MASSQPVSDQAPPKSNLLGWKIILKRTDNGGFRGRVVKISEEIKPPVSNETTKPPVSHEIKPKVGVGKVIKPLPSCVDAKLLKRPCLDDDEAAFEAKLEATARKLHDRYEQHEQAKRQRRIQVVNYLPEQQQFKLGRAKPQAKKLPGRNCLQKRVGNKGLPISRLVWV